MEEEAIARPLVFALNGARVEVQQLDPSMTLSTYLRTHTNLFGTKVGCGEGGCGACVVLVSRYDSRSKKVEEFTVNACLALVCSLDGCAVTTIEGIGSSSGKLHAIQKRFAGFHASQCGFCTPGMCMALYGFLRQNGDTKKPSGLQLQATDVEKSVTGNICRCTGYRPILDACSSFAADVDLEDLGLNSFWSAGAGPASRSLLPAYSPEEDDPKFPHFLIEHSERKSRVPLELRSPQGHAWIQASTLKDVSSLLQRCRGRLGVRYVVGNTSTGVYKEQQAQVLVDISRIPELLVLDYRDNGLEVGAAVTISKLIRYLEEASPVEQRHVYGPVAEHLNKVASPHVRNRASVGGNLVISQKFSFDSDLATLLLGLGASIKLLDVHGKQVLVSVEDFLAADTETGWLLQSIIIPSYSGRELVKFRSYRASPRPLGNSLAFVNSAFLVHFSTEPTTKEVTVKQVSLAFGAFGGKRAVRAHRTEDYLTGKTLCPDVLLEAIKLMKSAIKPTEATTKADYRVSVAVGFFYKFFSENTSLKNGELPGRPSRIISSKQEVQTWNQYHPVGKPSSKAQSDIQVAGEAVYVDDIPSPPNCLHASFVYSKKALARLRGTNPANGLASRGAVAFISKGDIPPGGENVASITDFSREPLFATDTVHYIGQPIGVMLADTAVNAKTAAEKVEVHYDESLGPPITTVEQAVEKSSYFEMWPVVKKFLKPKVGDIAAGFSEANHRIDEAEVRTGSQYFFYMETQTTLAVPDEDNCIVIYSSCQGPEYVQRTVACLLGLPMHNVRVITRRLGGGFGGKAFKACFVATACALAAFKLRRPVRMSLDRNTDMIMMGGRHMTKSVYSVGFTDEGKITALKLDVFIQAGWGEDLSPYMPFTVSSTLKKYNWGALEMNFKVCRTNIPARTAMRAPGETQGSFIADTVIEHVAAALHMDPYLVMEKNMHTKESVEAYHDVQDGDYLMPAVWKRLKATSALEDRIQQIDKFNSRSKWTKRGISMIPCIHNVRLYPRQARVSIFSDSSVVVEVGGVEMGQGLWTKVKQTTAYALSKLWDDGQRCVDMGKIRVVQLDSLSLANGGLTSGSTTSEGTCEAVNQACSILVERLSPIKSSQSDATWEELISVAKVSAVDLSAQSMFKNMSSYLTYGAAVSEVEIDVLTGETTILKSEIVYDCGKSMNPAVDIGQVEGAFVQGIGFFMTEEYIVDEQGKLLTDGTWTYKPPTIDNVPKVFNIELLNSPANEKRILSSKASGEPPLLLASSVHCAIRKAIEAARKDMKLDGFFRLDTPATMDKVKALCGNDNVEQYLLSAKAVNN